MIQKDDSIYTVCKVLANYIKKNNKDIKISESIQEYLNTCTLDISDKIISEQSKKQGLGEFDAFMSITYHKKHEEWTNETPLITSTNPKVGDDAFVVPSTCHIQAIHLHNGKIPIVHMHLFCGKGYELDKIAEYISQITNINRKNIDF